MASTPSKLKYNYIKSNFFRVIYAEGAFGGINTKGHINFSFFNERNALPQMSELDIETDDNGTVKILGPEKTTQSKEGIVRELEVDVNMSLEAAVSFHEWLGARINQLKELKPSGK
jgi:hypothetical protein